MVAGLVAGGWLAGGWAGGWWLVAGWRAAGAKVEVFGFDIQQLKVIYIYIYI